ncbi:hypothetical protein ACPF3S_003192 [Vibrio cholerae]|uniref:Uncharacterized protein n=1 Tax=Vibrio cholerae TaxID=666 RepID=A0A7Z7YEI0_VIBCL|nr:hypothetical protein [Vibrio cholerae]EGQ7707470.1 hypothetical protein [Vibrio cholerae]EGR5063491.1 hypothetical protein [Vibrio cholerae]EKF9501410.1 hypothetical protein [Vibrio cholerae]ELH0870626.1 hypothetical protein [Vibrio cholerae]PNV69078.1 hypothetical protein C1Y48_20215 [Vibrio cholerae]
MDILEICYTRDFCEYQIVDEKLNIFTVMRVDRINNNSVKFIDYKSKSTARQRVKALKFWVTHKRDRDNEPLDDIGDIPPYFRRHGFYSSSVSAETQQVFSRLSNLFH